MSIVIQVEPELSSQAEVIFEQLGTSISEATNTLLRYVVSRKKMPEVLNEPPVPCIDNMTEEELEELCAQGIAEIEAGHFCTADEVERRLGL